MTKRQVKPAAGNQRVQFARMAKARAVQERASLVGTWCNRGEVAVVVDDNPAYISIRVGTETFHDVRERFPTEGMIARIQLALHAGHSCRNEPPRTVQQGLDAMGYALGLETAYHNVAEITRTVTKYFRKGLRP